MTDNQEPPRPFLRAPQAALEDERPAAACVVWGADAEENMAGWQQVAAEAA